MNRLLVILMSAAAALAAPNFAYSQSELDQFEEIGESMATKMNQLFVAQQPGLADVLPKVEWDDEFRAAAKCVLDTYRSEAGDEYIAQLLVKGKAFVSSDPKTFSDFEKAADFLPDGISDERHVEISAECKMTELTIKRMDESGFSAALRGG